MQDCDKSKIFDDYKLLNLMVNDASKAKGVHRPGPYWLTRTKCALKDIKKFGLQDFRGMKSVTGTSFSDNFYVDIRGSYNFGLRSAITNLFRYVYPFDKFFDAQVRLTASYFDLANLYKNQYLYNNQRVKYLLSKYDINFETTRGGCLSFLEKDSVKIAHHYLQLLDTLDHIDNKVSLAGKKACFEIGGGFGVNTHLLVEIFKIKKIIYLDIVPNLYVGTQYLKSFYGEKVIDYRRIQNRDVIKFAKNNDLEIFCIAPHQIDKIESEVDFFHNAHSFVEMPEEVIINYVKIVESKLAKNNSAISIVSYGDPDLNTTIHPEKLPDFFTKTAEKFNVPTLTPEKMNFHYIIQ